MATVVRESIDRDISSSSDRRRAAGRHLLDAAHMDVPAPQEMKAELDALRAHHR